MNKTSLYFKSGNSDKEYHIQIKEINGGYVVNFQYGRVGSTLQTGTKTTEPVPLDKAEKIFNSLKKEKTSKGYTEGETSNNFSGEPVTSKEVIMLPQLLNEIQDVSIYIGDSDYASQEKKDGQRRMLISDGQMVIGLNKKGQQVELPLNIQYAVANQVCVLDGEIVGDKLFVFDLLELNGKDLRHLTFKSRFYHLESYMEFGEAIKIVETAIGETEKSKMYQRLLLNNREGIVFKNVHARYTAGRPASGGDQLKFKFVKTATFIVAGLTEGKRSIGLHVMDGEQKVFVGKVTIPPNKEIPKPGELVEVRYLYAYKGGCIFQGVYLDKRTDSDLSDCSINQLVYKSEAAC